MTQSHYSSQLETERVKVKLLEVANEESEETIKQQRKTINDQQTKIEGLNRGIANRDKDATQFINTMNHATANRKRVDWCYTLSPGKNQGRAKHHYGTYNGKRWEIKYDEWGCDPQGNY